MKKRNLLFWTLLFAGCMVEPSKFSLASYEMFSRQKHGYETSGITFETKNEFFYIVSDSGFLTKLDKNGKELKTWKIKGDLEGVTVVPFLNNAVFIIEEDEDKILHYDTANSKLVSEYKIGDLLKKEIKAESIAFMPIKDQAKGYFLVGSQKSARIYSFFADFTGDVEIKFHKEIIKDKLIEDVSGLFYDDLNNDLWILSDKKNHIAIFNMEKNKIVNLINIPGKHQEGLFVIGCRAYITEDRSGTVNVLDLNQYKTIYDCGSE